MLGLPAIAALPSCAAESREGLMLSSSNPALLACMHEGNNFAYLRRPEDPLSIPS